MALKWCLYIKNISIWSHCCSQTLKSAQFHTCTLDWDISMIDIIQSKMYSIKQFLSYTNHNIIFQKHCQAVIYAIKHNIEYSTAVSKVRHSSYLNFQKTFHSSPSQVRFQVLWKLRVSCQKGPTRHAYAWQIGPFWQDTLEVLLEINHVIVTLHCHISRTSLTCIHFNSSMDK